MNPNWCLLLLFVPLACGTSRSTPDVSGEDMFAEARPLDAAITDLRRSEVATETGDGLSDVPIPETSVPTFTRPEAGEPVSSDEISEVTSLYLELLEKTRYFSATEERVHGWPRSDPEGRYWFGTWWSGVRIIKENGKVTYLHSEDGSDNNGMRTGPLLAAACYAHALWGGQDLLVEELVRGYNSWILAMEREPDAGTGILMTRAHYPVSVHADEEGYGYVIDYSLNRPGKDLDEESPPSLYVHNPDNPHWGDIWVKNKRSKDDVGHMLYGLSVLPACIPGARPELEQELSRLADLYGQWCRRVEDDGWRIATVDLDWTVFFPQEDLAFYIDVLNTECKSMLAIRLYGRGDAGPLECGDGIGYFDEEWGLKNDFQQIQRSYHEAAAGLAFRNGDVDLGDALLSGLAWRLDRIFDAREASPESYAGPHDQDLAELVVVSATVGVPLTWREVRFLHDRLKEAHGSYLGESLLPHYDVFSPETPDGEYAFTPGGSGLFWRYLGVPLGLCASPYVNPTGKHVLDCEALVAARSPRN